MKKALCVVLASLICIISVFPGNVLAAEGKTFAGKLAGFRYILEDTSYEIDSTYHYNINLEITNGIKGPTISILSSPEELKNFNLSCIPLTKMSESFFQAEFSNGQGTIYLEYDKTGPLVDIVIGNKIYAFGGEKRIDKVKHYLETNWVCEDPVIAGQIPSNISKGTSTGCVKTASNTNIRFAAYWNPTKSNRLALLVNSVGTRTAEWISKIQILSGSVPSSYVIASANPSGSQSSSGNFVSFLQYLISVTTSVNVWLPGVSGSSLSSIYHNTFSFNLPMYVAWNNMHYTYTSSNGQTNGMLMYLFLDHNGVSPVPTGTVKLTTHVAATGTFTYTLSF